MAGQRQPQGALLRPEGSFLPLPQSNVPNSSSSAAMYDVYAPAFVPMELKEINYEAPLSIKYTQVRHRVDLTPFIAGFVGKTFLPDRAPIPEELMRPRMLFNGIPPLSPKTYLGHFVALREFEFSAKGAEAEGFAQYRVPIIQAPAPNQDLFVLSVPGLREDSPFIEMGDSIHLRQLFVDGALNLFWQYSMQASKAMAWDGCLLEASVEAVNRAQEVVYLRIEGIIPGTMLFNVSIPPKGRIIEGQANGLAFVHRELSKLIEREQDAHHELAQRVANIALNVAQPQTYTNGTHSETESSGPTRATPMRNDWIRRMLFPIETDGKIQTKLRKHSLRYGGFVDPVLNYEQAHGVISASSQDYGVLPFIISGPPGTGKTKTIVEVALQLLKTPNISHILIVAPSESAADTLADRLRIRLDNKQLLRLNGPWRNEIEVLSGLSRYCCLRKDRFAIPHFAVPHFADLMRYNVVITSARDVSLLADARVTNSDLYNIEKMMQNTFHPENHRSPTGLHWGALLMDEAAQATELDTLAALSIVCPPVEYPPDLHQPPFILAGDQHQLGPKTASRHPLYSQSLFGRLSTNPVYSSHPLSRSNTRPTPGQLRLTAAMLPMPYPPFINLTRNYRSHPAILSVPSHLFYHDTLIPEAHQPKTPLQSSPLWVGRKWPVVFVPHAGPDDIERDNAGWYNLSEATLACDIAAQLIEVSWVRPRDIVIMSPFAAQVKRLRALMRSRRYAGGSGYWEVNIGPLEAFQGLESRVVILCTTRTREKQVEEDIASGAGVVGMRRRMNVALTRAKEGLIVIGSEKVLGTDEAWRAFMSFCARNGLVRGQLERRWGDEREDLGVLERALIAREGGRAGEGGRILGGGVAQGDGTWAAELYQVLGEDYDGYGGSEGEEEEGEGEGEEEEGEEEGGEEWEDGYEEGEEREEAARN